MIAILVVVCLPMMFICNFLRYGRGAANANPGNSVSALILNHIEYHKKSKQNNFGRTS